MAIEACDVPPLPTDLAAALPFRRRRLRIDDHRVHLIDHGSGPSVLMIHGNPTWSFLWRRVVRRLPDYRVIAPDLVGFGLSDKPRRTSWHSVDRHVGILTALVDALVPGPTIVVGQDWGGPLAAGVAAHLEARGLLAGLVLGNTAILPPRRPLKATTFHRFSHLPGVSDLAFRGAGFPLPVLPWIQGDPSSIGRLERRAYRYPLRSPLDRAGPLALARMVPHRAGHPSLPALDRIGRWAEGYGGPASLIWGVRDPVLGRALSRMRRAWPQADVVETPAGHFLQEEVPERFEDAIRRIDAVGIHPPSVAPPPRGTS